MQRSCPTALYVVQCSHQKRQNTPWILCKWKVSKVVHRLGYSAWNLVRPGLARFDCTAVIALASQHVHWAVSSINLLDPAASVPALKVEFQVSAEDTVVLRRVLPPDLAFVVLRPGGHDHTTNALRA
jgi:hypothetical protein